MIRTSKVPSSKSEAPEKFQIPNFKSGARKIELELGDSLELGTWDLELLKN
jgi:hypothetical protein